MEFGEYVHYRISNVDTGSLDAWWDAGVWLGKRWRSTEHDVGTPLGFVKSYAVQRKPLEERWDAEAIEAITGTPWNLTPLPTDDEGPRALPPLPEDLRLREGPRPNGPEVRAPLRPRIKQADLDRWGNTDECLRCRLARSGKANDGSKHSEKCRIGIEVEMRREADPRVERAESKHIEYQEEVLRAREALKEKAHAATAASRGGSRDQ